VILHCIKEFIFVHRIPLQNGKSFIAQSDAFRRTNKRGDIVTSGESLLNNLLPGPTGRSYDKQFHNPLLVIAIASSFLLSRSENILLAGEILMRQPNQVHCRLQVLFVAYQGRDVSGLRRPTVGARFACGKNSLLISFRQANVAMALAMDMHEHCPPDKKRIVVDSRVLPLGYTRQVENPFSQFLMKSC